MAESAAKASGLWHGIPRSEIDWHPVVDEKRCIGCGLCFLTCGKGVYLYDWDRKKSVVVRPDQCVVGCQTCANLCPAEAIRFADKGDTPRAKSQRLIKERKVLPAVKKELNMMQS